MIKKIITITICITFILLVVTWAVDYFRVKDDKPPMFCLKQEKIVLNNGIIYECIGLGYKVYTYDLETLNSREFIMIFGKRKER